MSFLPHRSEPPVAPSPPRCIWTGPPCYCWRSDERRQVGELPAIRVVLLASGDSARYYAAFNAYHPMERIASPEEVAGFALVLLSPIAGFMTGAAIAFDGGSTAGRTWGASS